MFVITKKNGVVRVCILYNILCRYSVTENVKQVII